MRPFGNLISFDDALALVLEAATPIERTEAVVLARADGRVLARDIASTIDVPPFDRAAMDGYAVRASDTAGASATAPVTLTCIGELFTGDAPGALIDAGECLAIATGAPLPAGATAVVMVEATACDGNNVRVLAPVVERQNVGRRGGDVTVGQLVGRRGRLLNPMGVGALAAAGIARADVFVKPSVAIVSSGNELADPGDVLPPGKIYDVNRFTLEALVHRHGGHAVVLRPAVDTRESLTALLDDAVAHDVVVFSGGTSVGDRDLLVDVLRERGDVLFHGIAIKPGKPTLFARVGETPVFGMPGNPTSCLTNGYTLLVPLLRKMARLAPAEIETRQLPLAHGIQSPAGKRQVYTVRIVEGRVEPAFKTSGDITSMAGADGFVEIPSETVSIEAGTLVTVKLF